MNSVNISIIVKIAAKGPTIVERPVPPSPPRGQEERKRRSEWMRSESRHADVDGCGTSYVARIKMDEKRVMLHIDESMLQIEACLT